MIRPLVVSALVLLAAELAAAPQCVNKFVSRREGARQSVTLLTGKLTFQEAQKLAADIRENKAEVLVWVDAQGKPIAKQFGELKVVRPMPVGCDGRASGVVLTMNLMTVNPPSKTMHVKLNANTTVMFVEQ